MIVQQLCRVKLEYCFYDYQSLARRTLLGVRLQAEREQGGAEVGEKHPLLPLCCHSEQPGSPERVARWGGRSEESMHLV